ncbi:MAG: C40 family peptidase [Catonella sp.]|uniref:C40 family peptidase n=1 Tax=Catonella sp. TaxID=2382125 RepID=UPI003FA0787F
MRRKDFFLRCGVGAAVVAVSAAMLSGNEGVQAGSNAKVSGLAGISLFVDNAYVQGENRVVKAELDSVVPVDEILSSFNGNMVTAFALDTVSGVAEDENSIEITEDKTAAGESTDASDEDGSEGDKTADEMESTEEEVKSKYENIGISIADPYVNIRKKPGEDNEIIGKLYKGSKCDIIKDKGDWVKIESGNAKGYIKAEYLARGFDAEKLIDEYGTKVAVVNTETLNVRFEDSTDSRIATQIPMGEKLLVLQKKGDWYEVSVNDDGEEKLTGWVAAEFVNVKIQWKHAITIKEEKAEEERKAAAEAALAAQQQALAAEQARQQTSYTNNRTNNTVQTVEKQKAPEKVYTSEGGTAKGQNIANFALNFVGNPYVWGGTSLTRGTDCSGFVMSVYANFGIGLNRTSRAQVSNGYAVGMNELQPGDLVFYAANGRRISHVALYIGGGKVVHASTPRTGIIVSSVYHQSPYCARRIVK